MGLPALYYEGRNNPPHSEIWVKYFLRMVRLYSAKVCEISTNSKNAEIESSISFLKRKERELLIHLIQNYKGEFTPIEVSKKLGVTNKTVINRLSVLVNNGFTIPILVKERIRSYKLSNFSKENSKEIINYLEKE